MTNIAILASYNGSALDALFPASIEGKLNINLSCVITNNTNANVLNKAHQYHIPSFVVNQKTALKTDIRIVEILREHKCTHIFLAGYMKKISPLITNLFNVINSHPALLPKFGGKGMYGRFVHEAVINNKETHSGVTIHEVNEQYDEGKVILQKSLLLANDETVDTLEVKIKALEKIAIIEGLNLCLK
jgi:phosphoribosylglycinamide formyltransferase-1